jgi:hypothetical protein
MVLPRPDESAYDGNIVVKSTTYGKSKKGKVSGITKVRRAVASLNEEADKRLTIDRLDPASPISVENQVIINKEVCAALRKQALKLTTFIKNN